MSPEMPLKSFGTFGKRAPAYMVVVLFNIFDLAVNTIYTWDHASLGLKIIENMGF